MNKVTFSTNFTAQTLRYLCGLVAATAVYYLLSFPFLVILRRWFEISPADLSNPFLFVNTLLTVLCGWLYLPTLFWFILWVRRRYTDSVGFSEQHMGWTTIFFGVLLLAASEIPYPVIPLGIGSLWYGTGICFVFSGLLCLPAVREFVFRIPLGIVVTFLTIGWGVLAVLDLKLVSPSNVWPFAFVLSLIVILFTLFSFQQYERWVAFLGLALLTFYRSIPTHTEWTTREMVANWHYRGATLFFVVLGWTIVLGWGLGIFNKWGHPLAKNIQQA